MASFGFWHWCLRAPSRRPTPGRLRVPLRLEASAAVAALAVAAVLVGIPNPPREAASADQIAGGDPVLADLGHRDALSVADASGPFVVAITLVPPRPGPVQVRLQVEGLEPGDGLRQARVTGSSPTASGWEAALSPCGLAAPTPPRPRPRPADSDKHIVDVVHTIGRTFPTRDEGQRQVTQVPGFRSCHPRDPRARPRSTVVRRTR